MRKIERKITQLLMIPIILFLSTCSNEDADIHNNIPEAKPIELRADLQPRIQQDNSFAFDLFKKVFHSENNANMFISPLSISMALNMTLNGAEGETRSEMESALHLQGFSSEQINEYCRSLRNALEAVDPSTNFGIVNSIWYHNLLPVEENFININKEYLNAEIKAADFSDQKTLVDINNWCASNTNGKIPEIIKQISPDAMMYLINAVYFKGIWTSRFNKSDTFYADFYKENNQAQQVHMMSQTSLFNYSSDENLRYLELPYGNKAFSMILMLPHEDKAIDDIVSTINENKWNNALSNMYPVKVNLYLPRFKVECEYQLEQEDILPEMGMKQAFTDFADFSKISKTTSLSISKVIHKTFVEVDEEGSEAAAVTAVEMIATSIGGSEYVENYLVNKPFLFAIKEKSTGIIIFIGKIGTI